MYEQESHSLLNEILTELEPELKQHNLHHFYIRLGANFYAIYTLLQTLYGHRDDFRKHVVNLVRTLAKKYIKRPADLRNKDIEREKDYNWFLSQQWVGMALYPTGFSNNLKDFSSKVSYFQELGVNLVHIMPILECPNGYSDGGYAISNFRQIDKRAGTMEDLQSISKQFRQRDILLVLDVVVNHTSNEHEWALKAKQGNPVYQDYYYIYDDRTKPDMFEQTMPEVFPETDPGNFTWDEEMQKWVMTVFHNYQWDLNYGNPQVFIEMLEIILFWANRGADIIRMDAVAFIWKKMGTICQNEREAHLLLQLMKDCCQVTAPGVLFIAEAIVAPVEITKYFGEDAVIAKECEIAYNATYMALLWDALATKNTNLLLQGLKNLPDKLERATWLNYVRCHDDIGFGFADIDIIQAGYDPHSHRSFLIEYFTGAYADSNARGEPFMRNPKNGDARISGSLASLAGLEIALENGNQTEIENAINRILLMHSLIFSFGGIPLLYYGDELGSVNDYGYLQDETKKHDNRWIHRPKIDWDKAKLRYQQGTVQYKIFNEIKKMIAARKEISAFADFNNREFVEIENDHLFAFIRFNHQLTSDRVFVIANFDSEPQHLHLNTLHHYGFNWQRKLINLYTRARPTVHNEKLIVQPFSFYWIAEDR